MKMIDLRSDTFTKPTPEMLQAMVSAEVGDDVYGEDPTVNLLQDKIARLFGKEAALFVPSGTMSNQLSLKVLTEPGNEVITDADAHIFYYETAAPAILSNLQFRTIPSESGQVPIDEIEKHIRPKIYYFADTKIIALENTHNRHGGTVIDLDYIKDVKALADKHGIYTHLDGARIWNAHIASGVSFEEYGKYFDTISVCLSKGMGAPIGSLIISDKARIQKALKWRKIFGGGMRQVGYIAACGLYALENNLPLLKIDHENARYFANEIANLDGISIDLRKVQTNIVIFELDKKINSEDFVANCKERKLLLSNVGDNKIRIVTYHQISKADIQNAVEIVSEIMKKMMRN
ncbi:MAG: hypothetical protein CVV22_02385 [Ignavibacteriae bacterium HGW-Ignavibacteriae-1]|jgi:threonine aldolase|nr:MAG: hypothetical protein CVV22_02385 [Ignavibacteriae bacterium HGW-Ignavibacteriae-1]